MSLAKAVIKHLLGVLPVFYVTGSNNAGTFRELLLVAVVENL